MPSFEVLGITNEPGCCELCGTYCPARRVVVQVYSDDGGDVGGEQYWGVVCAAEARSGRRDSTLARQIRQDAEEAGEYDASSRPHAGRRRTSSPIRRQTRAQAAAAAARAFAESQAVWLRTSSPVPAEYQTETGIDAAAYRYRRAGRPIAAAVLMADDAGRLAAVDAADAADVDLFARHGFKPHAAGSLAAWFPEPAAA